MQAHDHGRAYYNQLEGFQDVDSFAEHYRDCWYSFFTPTPALASIVQEEMQRMHLFPGEFAFAHLRAQYGTENTGRDPALVKNWTVNSLNCLSHLKPGGP